MFDLRIDGGRVVRPWGEPTIESVGIVDGRIAAVGDLTDIPSTRVIDVGGTYLLPGVIDTHVHIGFTDSAREAEEDTASAAVNGVTTALIYFRSLELYDALLPEFIDLCPKSEALTSRFTSGTSPTTISRDGSVRRGIRDPLDQDVHDVQVRRAAPARDPRAGRWVHLRRHAGHCQAWGCGRQCPLRERRHRPPGRRSLDRPAVNPGRAVVGGPAAGCRGRGDSRVCLLAREAGARMHLPHLSSAEGLEAALEERARGRTLDRDLRSLRDGRGTCQRWGLGQGNPPVRRAADAERLCRGIVAGEVDTIGTDHAAWMRADQDESVVDAAPGNPGNGILLPSLLHSVNTERLTLPSIAAAQLKAARRFALDGKGSSRPATRRIWSPSTCSEEGRDTCSHRWRERLHAVRGARARGLAGAHRFEWRRHRRGWPSRGVAQGDLPASRVSPADGQGHRARVTVCRAKPVQGGFGKEPEGEPEHGTIDVPVSLTGANGHPLLEAMVAVVTGGNRGIGAAIAGCLAANGARVAVAHGRETTVADEELGNGLRRLSGDALVRRANVSDPSQVEAFFEAVDGRLGPLDILIDMPSRRPAGPSSILRSSRGSE